MTTTPNAPQPPPDGEADAPLSLAEREALLFEMMGRAVRLARDASDLAFMAVGLASDTLTVADPGPDVPGALPGALPDGLAVDRDGVLAAAAASAESRRPATFPGRRRAPAAAATPPDGASATAAPSETMDPRAPASGGTAP